MVPRISLVAFEDRPNKSIFVSVPNERGRYMRTDRSVAQVACPHCYAVQGEPCRSRHGYHAEAHVARREQARASYGRFELVDDLSERVESLPHHPV